MLTYILFFSLLLEIMKMRQLSQQNTQRVVEENRKLHSDLQGMMDELETRNKQIEELCAKSECNSRELELEKQKVRDLLSAGHFFYIKLLLNSLVICVVSLVFFVSNGSVCCRNDENNLLMTISIIL
jgi:hypothetical protein